MAKIEFGGIEKYTKQLAALGAEAEGVCKYAIYDAAGIVIDAIKASAPVDTGALRDSVKLSHMSNDAGYIYTRVSFEGTDRRGTANALKARTLERGRSNMRARPFVRPAVNRVRARAEASIAAALDKKIAEIMDKK